MRAIIIPAFLISIIITAEACKKSSPGPVVHNNSQLTVTVDTAIGSITHGSSPGIFIIDLKDPAQWDKVPVILHIDRTATSNIGTKVNDSTYLDTIDISDNKVAGVTIIAGNGAFTPLDHNLRYNRR